MPQRRQSLRLKYSGTVVYRAVDAKGRILYVGITDNLFGRMGQHRDSAKWWTWATRVLLEEYPSRTAAEERERELIKEHEPPFNVQHATDRMRRKIKKWDSLVDCKSKYCEGFAADDSDYCPGCILLSGRRLTSWQRRNYEEQAKKQGRWEYVESQLAHASLMRGPF